MSKISGGKSVTEISEEQNVTKMMSLPSLQRDKILYDWWQVERKEIQFYGKNLCEVFEIIMITYYHHLFVYFCMYFTVWGIETSLPTSVLNNINIFKKYE